MLKAILFDVDDTLLDWSKFTRDQWEPLERKCLRGVFDYLKSEGHPIDDFDALVREYIQRVREAWTAARISLRSPHMGPVLLETLEALGMPKESLDIERCLDAYDWGIIEGTTVFPDVPEILELLLKKGIKTGLITNAAHPMRVRDVELEQQGLLQYFPECRFSAADVGYLKPHPAIFQAALDCLGTKAAETVFVGDTVEHDIAGAQAVGMRAVLRVKRPAPPMISGLIIPDGAVNSLLELPAILDKWFPGW